MNEFNIYAIFLLKLDFAHFNGHFHSGSSIKHKRKIFRKTNISNPLIRIRTCAYQGVRNVSFSENFAYLLNGWSLHYIFIYFSNYFTVHNSISSSIFWQAFSNTSISFVVGGRPFLLYFGKEFSKFEHFFWYFASATTESQMLTSLRSIGFARESVPDLHNYNVLT